MHADGPRAVGPHGKPVEASASTTASDVGAMRETFLQYLNSTWLLGELVPCTGGMQGMRVLPHNRTA